MKKNNIFLILFSVFYLNGAQEPDEFTRGLGLIRRFSRPEKPKSLITQLGDVGFTNPQPLPTQPTPDEILQIEAAPGVFQYYRPYQTDDGIHVVIYDTLHKEIPLVVKLPYKLYNYEDRGIIFGQPFHLLPRPTPSFFEILKFIHEKYIQCVISRQKRDLSIYYQNMRALLIYQAYNVENLLLAAEKQAIGNAELLINHRHEITGPVVCQAHTARDEIHKLRTQQCEIIMGAKLRLAQTMKTR